MGGLNPKWRGQGRGQAEMKAAADGLTWPACDRHAGGKPGGGQAGASGLRLTPSRARAPSVHVLKARVHYFFPDGRPREAREGLQSASGARRASSAVLTASTSEGAVTNSTSPWSRSDKHTLTLPSSTRSNAVPVCRADPSGQVREVRNSRSAGNWVVSAAEGALPPPFPIPPLTEGDFLKKLVMHRFLPQARPAHRPRADLRPSRVAAT